MQDTGCGTSIGTLALLCRVASCKRWLLITHLVLTEPFRKVWSKMKTLEAAVTRLMAASTSG